MPTIGDIEQARENVRDVEDHILRQTEHIADLESEGIDIADANALLAIYQASRAQLERHVATLLSELERETGTARL